MKTLDDKSTIRLINACLAVTLACAWLIEGLPKLTPLFIVGMSASTIAGLAFFSVNKRQRAKIDKFAALAMDIASRQEDFAPPPIKPDAFSTTKQNTSADWWAGIAGISDDAAVTHRVKGGISYYVCEPREQDYIVEVGQLQITVSADHNAEIKLRRSREAPGTNPNTTSSLDLFKNIPAKELFH